MSEKVYSRTASVGFTEVELTVVYNALFHYLKNCRPDEGFEDGEFAAIKRVRNKLEEARSRTWGTPPRP